MALKDTWVPIRFMRGIDTESDDKTLEPGTPTAVENGVYNKGVTIEKRHGTERLSRRRATADGTYQALSGALGLASRDDESDLVMLTTTDEVISYDATEDAWVKRGDWANLSTAVDSLSRGSNERFDPSTAVIGDVRLVSWQDARDGIHVQMFDRELDAFASDFRVGGSGGRQARALAVDNRFHVYFTSGTELHVAVLDAARPTSKAYSTNLLHPSLSSSVSIGSCPYDVCTHPSLNRAFLAASIADWTYVASIRSNGVIGTSGSSQPFPDPFNAPMSMNGPAIAVSHDALQLALGFKDSLSNPSSDLAGSYAVNLYDISFGLIAADPVIADSLGAVTGSNESVIRHTICFASGTSLDSASSLLAPQLHVFLEMSASLVTDRYIRKSTVHGQTQLSTGSFRRHSRLGSKAFLSPDGSHNYVWLNRPSTNQSTDYLYREDRLVAGRSRPAFSVADVSGCLSNVDVVGDSAFRAVTNRDLLPVPEGSGSQFSSRHVRLSETTFQTPSSWQPIDVGGVLHMPGGWIGTYDGSNVVELGFGELIDSISGSAGSASLGRNGIQTSTSVLGFSGPLSTASFIYAVVPEYFDAYGHREPGGYASILTMHLSGSPVGQVQNTCSLTWPNIVHTMKDGTNAANIKYSVYRSGPNGVVLQRIDDPAFPIVNSTASDYTTFVDTFSEVTRAAGETIYTLSEEMNVLPSSGRLLTAAGDRLYVAGIEDDDNFVAGSKLRFGGAVTFADGGGFPVDSAGGPITAIAGLDSGLAVFKRSKIFGASAEGPENTVGSTQPWPLPASITSDVGAREPAVVFAVAGRTEQGLVFESERGVRLLERGATVKDIGWPARSFDPLSVVAGIGPRMSEEARLYTSEGTTLVFNTRRDTWSTFPAQPAVGATLWNGLPVRAEADGFCYVEDPDSYRDGDSAYPLSITLGWMSFAGIQGLSRVRKVFLLGNFKSHHTLRLEMQADYRDSWRTVGEINTVTALGIFPYGGPPSYGSGSLGGVDPVYQFEFDLPIQRFQSVRFRISDTAISGSGAGFSLTEMKLLVSAETSRPSIAPGKRR